MWNITSTPWIGQHRPFLAYRYVFNVNQSIIKLIFMISEAAGRRYDVLLQLATKNREANLSAEGDKTSHKAHQRQALKPNSVISPSEHV